MARLKKLLLIAGLLVVMLLVLLVAKARYPGITGKVVDAETGRPIPGALVLVQWWLGHGIGFTYHTVYKTVETQTDEEGKFSVPGAYHPLVDAPAMLIFSKGYVPWRNDDDFEEKPDYQNVIRKVIWKNNETYRLKELKPDYSRDLLKMFISSGFQTDSTRQPLFSSIEKETGRDAMEEINKAKNKFKDGGGK